MKRYLVQTNPLVVPTNDGKVIREHHGNVATSNSALSIAHMIAPPQWSEPFQSPEFDEYTFIIKGKKQFVIDGDTIVLNVGESIHIKKDARVQYSNPFDEPCEYLAVCMPAFSIEKVNRED